jgi:lysine 6-dehydrogenase
MPHSYAILGSGMQGTAAAYDLVKFADPTVVLMADVSLEQAKKSCDRVNMLTGKSLCEPRQVNALDHDELRSFLEPVNVLLSCVPYWMHPAIASIAIEARTHMCDLGGNTDVTWQTLKLDDKAKAAGVSLVPDCGLAPGLVNSIGLWLIEQLDAPESVKLYCGVLPQHPVPPFNYKLTFNVEGLVTEYDYQALVLRDGKTMLVDTLSELEDISIDELGPMEAFTTSGGTSTAVYTLEGKLKNYEYKTIRFPGHCGLMRIFKDFGFWNEAPVEVRGVKVVPKDVFNRVFGESLGRIQDLDQCAIRGVATGTKGGRKTRLRVDLFDRQCEETGFTSMERLTGFSLAIYAKNVVDGNVKPGSIRYEEAMTGGAFIREFEKRGFKLKFAEEYELQEGVTVS